MYAQQESFVTIENSDLDSNVADYGGAIRVYTGSTMHIMNSRFSGNIANLTGGAVAAYKNSSMIIQSSTFTANEASFASVLIAYNSNTTFDNNTVFCNNVRLGSGGVMYIFQADITVVISGSTFQNNSAGSDGGVMHAQGSAVNVESCLFEKNGAGHNGGAVYSSSSRLIIANTFLSE